MRQVTSHTVTSALTNLVIGPAIPNDPKNHEDHQLGVKDGGPTAGSDSTSSTTYAFEAVISALAGLGAAAYVWGIPITFGLVAILGLVIACYRLGIKEYPEGGGAYKIALANLFPLVALVAAASLLMNYILTVSVSDSSLIDQLLSIVPWLNPLTIDIPIWMMKFHLEPIRVLLNIAVIVCTCILNLRGPKSAGKPVSFLYYSFVSAMLLVFVVGFSRMLTGNLPESTHASMMKETLGVASPGLILFSLIRGCILISGAEAVSTEGPFFKKPKDKTAIKTLLFLGAILGSLALGIAILGTAVHVAPVDDKQTETVISQIIRAVFTFPGVGFTLLGVHISLGDALYVVIEATAIGILFLGGNTPFTAFPALVKFLAEDGYLHRQLSGLGRRLELRRAIFFLTGCSIAITVIFQGNTLRMLGLYGIGVFLGYIVYMGGLTRLFVEKKQWKKVALTTTCAVISFAITLGFLITNFADGSWITLIGIVGFVVAFIAINKSYNSSKDALTIVRNGKAAKLSIYCKRLPRSIYVALISDVHQGAVDNLRHAVAGANAENTEILAVHFDEHPDVEHSQQIRYDWDTLVRPCIDVPIQIIPAVYREVKDPLREFILQLQDQRPGYNIELVCGQLVANSKLEESLHRNSWKIIHESIRGLKNVTLKIVPYPI